MDDSTQPVVDQPANDAGLTSDQSATQPGAIVQPDNTAATADEVASPLTGNNSAFLELTSQPAPSTEPPEEAKLNPMSRVSVEPITPPTPPIDINQLAAAEEANEAAVPTPVADPTPTPVPVDPTPVFTDPVATDDPADDNATQTLAVPPNVQAGAGDDEELLGVKQQALEQLTPIVDKIELPAEERFDTLMMIIRASDDKRLIKPAYDAANEIPDPDKKARALIDVVNEVNYLTQNQPDQE